MLLRVGFHTNVASLGGAAAPPVPWTPDELGATVTGWWDAGDTSTITDAGSGNITWADKSANGSSLIHGAAGPATGTQTQNSLNVLAFNGAQALYNTTASGLSTNAAGVTLVAAFKNTSATSFVFTTFTGAPVYCTSLRREAGEFRFFGYQTGTHAAIADSTSFVVVAGTATTTLRQIYKNGTAGTSNSTTDSAAGSQVHIRLCGGYGFENIMAGQIGEIILLDGTGDTNRQLAEGYLAWRWGTVSDLDAGHPYKSAAPTV